MIRKIGIIISIVLGLILTAAAICVSITLVFPDMDNKLIPLISDNWLIIIFKLHSKIINPSTNQLHVVNLYDIFIITLFILISICLYLTLKKKNKIWFLSAISLLILGIIILLITLCRTKCIYGIWTNYFHNLIFQGISKKNNRVDWNTC
jgi:hypothetical protein